MAFIIKIDPERPSEEAIDLAVQILKEGGIVSFPTETLYGLAVNALDESAVKKLFQAKERNLSQPIPILINQNIPLKDLVLEIPPVSKTLMNRFWPDGLTLVFLASDKIPKVLTGTEKKIGIRFSSNLIAHNLIDRLSAPITSTSANISGQDDSLTAEDVEKDLGDRINLILDGGTIKERLASTVVDVTTEPPTLLREGKISATLLALYLNDFSIDKNISYLKDLTRQIRIDVIKMINEASSGHTGGSLSCAEIMVALYFSHMNHDSKNPLWEDRDRFILSKGHGCPTLYACMARSGYFHPSELFSLRKLGSRLQGHPNRDSLEGIEASTGSLGQGLSIANGIALAMRLNKKKSRVYVLIGDGESQEGQIWEAAMTASHHKLDNLCAFTDYNRVQLDGRIEDIMDIRPLEDKWRSFGWEVMSIDGHSFPDILEALDKALETKGKPFMIIANTIKGKGVSFFEGKAEWHGKAPNDPEMARALEELDK